ncbi:hypothetical protein P3L51_29190 [Streptomyces sp. PSRA5]|uniref:hypothetical protein n=1 Tax=Streptomyces panacea TaxID=3035064 RepID=UPI00339BFD10
MEWADPRYTDAVARYRAEKVKAGPQKKRPGLKGDRVYGDPFVVFVDPATLKPYTVAR